MLLDPDLDPDPDRKMNGDPCGSGSTIPHKKHYVPFKAISSHNPFRFRCAFIK
jgi:hypothetical protein